MPLLSVLIPTCNYKCYTLVADLHTQLQASGIEYEIILAEDGSRDQVSIISNHRITELPHCRHIINRENVGRALILNQMIAQSKGEWCLLTDSDAKVVRNDFISKYLSEFRSGYDIISGDLVNPTTLPTPQSTLRYRYEKSCETWRTPQSRNHNPYRSFCTFNIMARRQALLDVPFDPRCTEYGYEDTLLGIELGRRGYKVLHIDNPLMHLGFEPNDKYLRKVETSLHTLKRLGDSLIGETRITRLSSQLTRMHLAWIVRTAFLITRPLLRRNLLSPKPNMNIFAFYKLGYYISIP